MNTRLNPRTLTLCISSIIAAVSFWYVWRITCSVLLGTDTFPAASWLVAIAGLLPAVPFVLFMRKRPSSDAPLTAGCTLLLLAAAGVIASMMLGTTREGLTGFVLAVLLAPSIPVIMMRPLNVKPRAESRSLLTGSIICAFQNITLMLPVLLMYSLMVHLSLLGAVQSSMKGGSAAFYLSTSFICLCLTAGAWWLKYVLLAFAASSAESLVGSAVSSGLIALGLTFADWRMGLAALWVIPLSPGMLWRKYLYVPYLVPVLGLVSVAMAGAGLYSAEALSGAKFLMFLLAASRMYDPLESAIRTVHEQEAK